MPTGRKELRRLRLSKRAGLAQRACISQLKHWYQPWERVKCFTEGLEIFVPNADGSVGQKGATGANEAASVLHDSLGSGVISMLVLRKNPDSFPQAAVAGGAAFAQYQDDEGALVQSSRDHLFSNQAALVPEAYLYEPFESVPAANNNDSQSVSDIQSDSEVPPSFPVVIDEAMSDYLGQTEFESLVSEFSIKTMFKDNV